MNLDNCRATQVEGLTDEFKNLESLSMINVGLTTLKGFPALPNLKKLELSDNRILSGLNPLQECKSLTHLSLSGNRIASIEALEPLASLENLAHLDLFNCDVTNLDSYREKVFANLPNLKYLDGFDKDNQEVEDEEEADDDDDDEDGLSDGLSDAEGEGEGDEDGLDDLSDDDGEDEEDEDDEDEDDEDDEEEDGIGLNYLQQENIGDDSGEDFDPAAVGDDGEDDEIVEDEEEEDEEGDEEEDEEDESSEARGVKRKHEDEEGGDGDV